jgi:hypothetical protein
MSVHKMHTIHIMCSFTRSCPACCSLQQQQHLPQGVHPHLNTLQHVSCRDIHANCLSVAPVLTVMYWYLPPSLLP